MNHGYPLFLCGIIVLSLLCTDGQTKPNNRGTTGKVAYRKKNLDPDDDKKINNNNNLNFDDGVDHKDFNPSFATVSEEADSALTGSGRNVFEVESQRDPDISATLLLDNQLMRDVYRVSTDKAYTVGL